MTDKPKSRNFEFLRGYDPLLAEYGLRAELYVYTDPNASLVKSRQFAEVVAKSTANRAGLDCTDISFEETVGMMKRQRLIPREVVGYLTQLRLAGNAAAHEHERDRNAALQSLICAYELAKWFNRSILNDTGQDAGPFKPPPKPEDATRELREEIDFLRQEAARFELAASATEADIRTLSQKLEQEAAQYHAELVRQESELREREGDLQRLERESRERLRQVTAVAASEPFQSFVARSAVSASRIGRRGEGELPLTQLRIVTGRTSKCCGAPMIIVQSKSGGWVRQSCSGCNNRNSTRRLSQDEFLQLPVYVACAKCRRRAEPSMIRRNYGYRCNRCGWECELASLVPHYTDAEPPASPHESLIAAQILEAIRRNPAIVRHLGYEGDPQDFIAKASALLQSGDEETSRKFNEWFRTKVKE
jgi:hypothetical protein